MSFVEELQERLEAGIVVHGRSRRRRRRLAGAAGMAAAAAVVALAAVLTGPPDRSSRVATEPVDETAAETPTTGAAPIPTRGLPVPDPPPVGEPDEPGRSFGLVGSVTVWTGEELFVWGGAPDFGSGTVTSNDGILYDIATGTWRDLPPAPGGPQAEAVGVWTGSEVLVCCGKGSSDAGALAFTPSTGTWRELPPPPAAVGGGPAAVWADGEFYVVARQNLVAYNPTTDSWRELAPPPIELGVSPAPSMIAADDQLVVWPRPSARSSGVGLVYDVSSDSWSELPPPPAKAWPAAPDIAWTGSELIVAGGLPAPMAEDSERLVGARLDWRTGRWSALPDIWPEPVPSEGNIGSQSILWTGEVLLVAAGDLGSGVDPLDNVLATYDPADDRWRRLPSLDGTRWRQPLVAVDGEVVAVSHGRLERVAVGADAGEPVGSDGLQPAGTPDFTDIAARGTPLTLVGSNGNGAGMLVLDLDLGLQTIYEPGRHHRLGPGGLTDMAMGDTGALYVWRTSGPTVRFRHGALPFDGGNRLSFGELSQPSEVVQVEGPERSVVPLPASEAFWVWETGPGGGIARLVDENEPDTLEVDVDGRYDPLGTTADGGLVLVDDASIAYVSPEGRWNRLGPGSAVAVTGDEVLVQECLDDVCSRRWVDPATGRTTRPAGEDRFVWSAPAGPTIPSRSAPMATTSPDGTQMLVTVGDTSEPSTAYELVRVEVATMESEVVPLPHDVLPVTATWSRDGRYVVATGGRDVVVVNLRTGDVERHRDLVPDGYFLLAAG